LLLHEGVPMMGSLVATFINTTTDTLTQFGVAGMFARWPAYALPLGSIAALFLQQAALHIGPLRVSQPSLVIVDPLFSIALSAWLLGEQFIGDTAAMAMAAVGFTVMRVGAFLLTQTSPPTMGADLPSDAGACAGQPWSRQANRRLRQTGLRAGRRRGMHLAEGRRSAACP
jgi:hypothetical protein